MTYFNYVLFENPTQITFEENDMSNVSFVNTDIAKVKFQLDTTCSKKYKFKVIEEEWLDNSLDYCQSLKYLLNLRDTIKEDESRQINFNDDKNLLQINLCSPNVTFVTHHLETKMS